MDYRAVKETVCQELHEMDLHVETDCFEQGPSLLPPLGCILVCLCFQLGCKEITEDCLMVYFESKPPPNQFLCRAYFCQAQLSSPFTVCTVEDMDKAVMFYLKAIEISVDNPRYHFLVFNASVLYFQTVRVFLRPGQRQHLVSSLTQVLSALEVVNDPDYTWRAELMLLFVECLVDGGKHKEAAAFAKVTADFIELHKPEMYPRIFSIQVRHNLVDASKTLLDTSPKILVIYKMQKLKHVAEVSESRNECVELREIFILLTQSSKSQSPASHSSSPDLDNSTMTSRDGIPLADRTELLLELTFLSLQLKEHQTAEDCLKVLEADDGATVGQRIMMECAECELALQKQKGHIEDYTKSSVEVEFAQLAVVGRLDALLRKAVRQGDGRVTQCVCASLWNSCLPLLQNNLRRSIKRPLLTLAHALEGINSMLLDMRCQVHAELAAIEEEEQRLETALKHLQTALVLDEKGQQHQRLSSSLHLLQLHTSLYTTPVRPEDRAALLIQQAREGSGCGPAKKWRPMLVSAGIALAPDFFQMVLDADSAAKGNSPQGMGHVEQLAARAQQHMTCAQKMEGHLASLERGRDDRERMRLWASLVKAARKQEAWDVCRTACCFCLLYDDGRWKNKRQQMNERKPVEGNQSEHAVAERQMNQGGERDLLRLLAEVHFISAEATIHKLRSEGVELNGSPVLPVERGARPKEDDPCWTLYSDWIQEQSANAMANFLRGAELGAEIQEAWLVANAAVYLWNYNSHLQATQRHGTLLATFSRLVELLRQTGHAGEVVLLVLLCDAVAQGIIQPWCGTSGQIKHEQDSGKAGMQQQAEKAKKGGGKISDKSGSTHGLTLEAAAVQDIKKALEMCDYALRLSNGNEEIVPIMVRKQLIGTWVNTKCLLQQQIGQKLDTDDESKNEAVAAMSRVLVGVEMLLCNTTPRLMEFNVPSLGTLARMASDCKWSDPVVELYVWSQLAHFAHQSLDYDLVVTCTQNALQLEKTAIHKAKVTACSLYSVRTVKEMLSSSACLRGLSILQKSDGNLVSYTAALGMLQSSIRKPLELIVKALTNTSPQPGTERRELVEGQKEQQTGPVTSVLDEDCQSKDDLAVRAAMYNVLFHIYADIGSWKSGLQILDQAIREMPRSPQRLLLYKQRVLVKAKLGQSIVLDMQRFTEEGELTCALMWHRVALCANDTQQQLTFYQNTIKTLQSTSYQRQKVDFLLEFGEWLYCSKFPVVDAQLQIQRAIDILLSTTSDTSQSLGNLASLFIIIIAANINMHVKIYLPLIAYLFLLEPSRQTEGLISVSYLSELREVWRLDGLLRAYTLLAFMESRVSPQHQQYLLQAYSSVLQIWKVSMESVQDIIKEELKNPVTPAPPMSAASTKKDKEKEKEKGKRPPLVEKKPRALVSDSSLPSSPEEWAQFECPEDVRQAFRHDSGPHSINMHSISVQSRTLFYLDVLVRELESVSLTLLTLPPLHLAEVVAHDLSRSKSHSDLYRLRIVKTCCNLGLESSSPYREALLNFARVPEDEQMACRKAIALQRERNGYQSESKINQTNKLVLPHSGNAAAVDTLWKLGQCSVQELWLDKAAVCLTMGLYQPARSLLAEAHLVSKELGDQTSFARSYHLLALLASHEQQHGQACALLEQAEKIGGDEDFWYHLTQSLLNTTAECGGKDTYTKVCHIVDRAIRLLRSALEQSPNRAPVLYFYIASLQARGAVLCRSALRPACTGPFKTLEKLKSVCETLKLSAAALLEHGYRAPAAETTLEQANSLRMLAMLTSIKEEKQQYLLDALMLVQQAVSLQEEVLSCCIKVLPAYECGRYSLPAMRMCVDFRLALVDLGLLMLEMQCEDEMLQAEVRNRKSSIERAVDDYIRSNTDLNTQEQEWYTVTQSLGQMALTQLSVINSLSLDCIETKARYLGMLGRCLRLVLQRDPIYTIPLWDRPIMADSREEGQAHEDNNVEEASRGGVDESTIQNGENTANNAELQTTRRAVQQKLTQASETLTQALSLALQHNFPQVLSQVCVDLVECHSQYDPAACGQYLALLQSCMCCTEMSNVLRVACSDTGQSQLAALLGLQKTLQSKDSSLHSAINHSLHTLSKGYQHLTINPNHLNFLEEMPPNLKILLLQHSGDGSVLYAAFYEKTKAIDGQKGKSMQITGGLACSRVAKARVQPSVLLRLRDQARAFRRLAAQKLLKESRNHKHVVPGEQCTQLDTSTERELGLHLQLIVQEMEDYLSPVLSQFDFCCFSQRPPSISIGEAARPKDKEERGAADKALPVGLPAEQGECVVVLADRMLLELPLEALAVLRGEGISSVSRDFSLQVFYTRLQREQPVESDNKKETKGGKAAKGKGDQSKAIKAAPVNRVLPPNSLPVDTNNFRCIPMLLIVLLCLLDLPYNTKWSSPAERMRKTLEMYSEHFTPLWDGIIGNEHDCRQVLTDLEHLLANCSSFIFYGTERFLAHISPARLATLNLTKCQMAILFDLVQTNTSMLRQSQQDVQKSEALLDLEGPLQCVYLLTLCGVHSIMLNQWSSSAKTNALNMEAIMESRLTWFDMADYCELDLLKKGLTSGQSVHTLRRSALTSESDVNALNQGELMYIFLFPPVSECLADVDSVLRWGSPSALNFIIYGLPNLVVT
ncbi:hypothetical protein NFI96_034468 [Prochilodus magdalenae]|nr:hypothetical protein NFI96_034468 [Prochilodus magdalenae]